MILQAWRIVRKEQLDAAFTGQGARLYPGRWNSQGVAVVYTAGSISLAVLEMLVHLTGVVRLPKYYLIEVQFDESLVTELDLRRLPRNWRRFPAPAKLRQFGDAWIRSGNSAVLRVHSAITGEPNYLLNPGHPDFRALVIGKPQRLNLDIRLLPARLRPQRRPKN